MKLNCMNILAEYSIKFLVSCVGRKEFELIDDESTSKVSISSPNQLLFSPKTTYVKCRFITYQLLFSYCNCKRLRIKCIFKASSKCQRRISSFPPPAQSVDSVTYELTLFVHLRKVMRSALPGLINLYLFAFL